jgi:hypothetical protein
MFDVRCFEPGGIAQTKNLVAMDPAQIRQLMARDSVREAIDAKEKWGEDAAAICLVGCREGFRGHSTIDAAYLVYECQNISLQEAPLPYSVANQPLPGTREVPLFSDSWLPPRGPPGPFSSGEQKLLAELQNSGAIATDNGNGGTRRRAQKKPETTLPSRKGRSRKQRGKKRTADSGGGSGEAAESSSSAAGGGGDGGNPHELQLWRCISPGNDLQNVNLLHGGMPCSQEDSAQHSSGGMQECKRPWFDMGFSNITL